MRKPRCRPAAVGTWAPALIDITSAIRGLGWSRIGRLPQQLRADRGVGSHTLSRWLGTEACLRAGRGPGRKGGGQALNALPGSGAWCNQREAPGVVCECEVLWAVMI